MSTSDRIPDPTDDADTSTLSGGSPTSPGPDSTDAGAATAATAGSGQNIPDTGPGPAAADVDDKPGH